MPRLRSKATRMVTSATAAVVLYLFSATGAGAYGGHYVFVGGTPAQRAVVVAALDASRFDWSLVQETVTIVLGPGLTTSALPETISIDSDLLDAGRFAWGPIQHEYAHVVDYSLLDPGMRAYLGQRLGGASWWQEPGTPLPHGQLASERFATEVAWSYWPSPSNSLKPSSAKDEGGSIAPRKFRLLLARLIHAPDLIDG